MTDNGKPPKLGEMIRTWVFRRLGVPGLVVLTLLVALAYAYTNWDKVKTWPGMASVVAYLSRHPVPHADPNRFSVLVAHLENDEKGEHERLIVEALKEFEGVQVLKLDRTISLEESTVPEEMEKRGQEKARRYLQDSGASVLIWGMVLSRGGSTVYKLYWTPASGAGRQPERYGAPRAEEQLRLPEVFWSDLAHILRLLVTAKDSEFRAQEGHYVADQLLPFIARVRTLLRASAGRSGWDADTRGATLLILADALQVRGEQSGQNEPLKEAVATYREALKEHTRERVPLDWAMTQNNLGSVLRILGERDQGTQHLEEAVAAYQAALGIFEAAQASYYVEVTKANLRRADNLLRQRRSP